MIKIYHNSRCTKSRQGLELLENSGKKFEVIKYLEEPPGERELIEILSKLKMAPIDLVRKKEKIWLENYKGMDLSDKVIIRAMVKHPILIERPIVIRGKKGAIGRPLENIAELIS